MSATHSWGKRAKMYGNPPQGRKWIKHKKWSQCAPCNSSSSAASCLLMYYDLHVTYSALKTYLVGELTALQRLWVLRQRLAVARFKHSPPIRTLLIWWKVYLPSADHVDHSKIWRSVRFWIAAALQSGTRNLDTLHIKHHRAIQSQWIVLQLQPAHAQTTMMKTP